MRPVRAASGAGASVRMSPTCQAAASSVTGRPAGRFGAQRQANVLPDGPGFTTLSVVDGEGRSASVTVRVE